MRVFFDASVIIAALLSPSGGSALLLQFIKTGTIVGIISQTVIEEIVEEDKRNKLHKTKEEIEQFIAESGLVVSEAITLDEIKPYQNMIDEEDAHLIAGATLTKCSYLVSFDKKHVLREDIKKRFLPLIIVNPKGILEELVKE
jgi:putative PIN family toxin of toxin-antitoxin system